MSILSTILTCKSQNKPVFFPRKEIYVKELSNRVNICPQYKVKTKFHIIILCPHHSLL